MRAMFTRPVKRLIAKACMALLLFMQIAVAAYACPGLLGTGGDAPGAMPATIPQTEMAACAEIDATNANLCVQYWQTGNQSVEIAPQIHLPPTAVLRLAVMEPVQPASAVGVTILPLLLERTTAPPPSIRFGILRI
jgi:hypothetical protein